jgi:hypothetical protein
MSFWPSKNQNCILSQSSGSCHKMIQNMSWTSALSPRSS